jgi:hypothetical protein
MHEFKSVSVHSLALIIFNFFFPELDALMRSSLPPALVPFFLSRIVGPTLIRLLKLWAILLRNSSAAFVEQSTAVDFLETIETLIVSSTTSPVVRNRLLHVLGDVVHNHPTREHSHLLGDVRDSCALKEESFRRLWIAVKPADAPEQVHPSRHR